MQKKSTIRLILAVLLLTFGITTQAEIKNNQRCIRTRS